MFLADLSSNDQSAAIWFIGASIIFGFCLVCFPITLVVSGFSFFYAVKVLGFQFLLTCFYEFLVILLWGLVLSIASAANSALIMVFGHGVSGSIAGILVYGWLALIAVTGIVVAFFAYHSAKDVVEL